MRICLLGTLLSLSDAGLPVVQGLGAGRAVVGVDVALLAGSVWEHSIKEFFTDMVTQTQFRLFYFNYSARVPDCCLLEVFIDIGLKLALVHSGTIKGQSN